MTEIPEHLLKRSRERRAASGAGGDDVAAAKPAAATPATTAGSAPAAASGPVERAAVPAPAGPPPPKPDTAVVAAYKSRRRIPFWAMVALSALPVWAFMYARAVTQSPVEAAGPLGLGAEVYGGCASCHGGGGGGGVGYAFTGGEVLDTFPHIEDQLRYVYFGTSSYNIAGIEIYGNPEREGGVHVTGAQGPDARSRRASRWCADRLRDPQCRVPRALRPRRRRPGRRVRRRSSRSGAPRSRRSSSTSKREVCSPIWRSDSTASCRSATLRLRVLLRPSDLGVSGWIR